MKIYIDGQNNPKRPGWAHCRTFEELKALLSTADLSKVELIYIGRNLEDENGERFPAFDMYDCAVELISAYMGKPIPECTVASKSAADLLHYYNVSYNYTDKCTEIN